MSLRCTLLARLAERSKGALIPRIEIWHAVQAAARDDSLERSVSAWNWLERAGLISAARLAEGVFRISILGRLYLWLSTHVRNTLLLRLALSGARYLLAPQSTYNSRRIDRLRRQLRSHGGCGSAHTSSLRHAWYARNPTDRALLQKFIDHCVLPGDVVYDVEC